MSTMRAAAYTEFGGPEVLGPVEIPRPEPGPGQVRVRVVAATVNPTDTARRAGWRAEDILKDPGPYAPGMEFAGYLDALGPGASTPLSVGDPVMGIIVPAGSNGAYAEYVVLPPESIVAAPANVDLAAAATVPMNGLSARMSLDLLDLRPGQTLAVTGAAGAYGGYVVQLAKADGLRVIADASEKDRELVASLGADVVVERGPDVAQRFREIAPDGVDGLADGAVQNEEVIGAVKDGGRLVTVRFYEAEGERGVTYHPLRVREYVTATVKLDQLRQQVESGALSTRVAATYDYSQATDAHLRLEAGGQRGRLVLTFPEHPRG